MLVERGIASGRGGRRWCTDGVFQRLAHWKTVLVSIVNDVVLRGAETVRMRCLHQTIGTAIAVSLLGLCCLDAISALDHISLKADWPRAGM